MVSSLPQRERRFHIVVSAGSQIISRDVTARAAGSPTLQLLERAFSVLDRFTFEHDRWTTTGLARACELPIPTTHRILVVLDRLGYVARDPLTREYRLGPAATDLGRRSLALVDLRKRSLAVLRWVADTAAETALLSVVSDAAGYGYVAARVDRPDPLGLSLDVGRPMPLHAGASFKVLLAHLDDERMEALVTGRLERRCSGTITEPDRLRRHLADVRARGWAYSCEETDRGAWGLAVPVLDGGDGLVCGLGVAGPTARLRRDRLPPVLAVLRRAARRIGENLPLGAPRTLAGDGR